MRLCAHVAVYSQTQSERHVVSVKGMHFPLKLAQLIRKDACSRTYLSYKHTSNAPGPIQVASTDPMLQDRVEFPVSTYSFSAALVPRCCVFTDTTRKACSFSWTLGPHCYVFTYAPRKACSFSWALEPWNMCSQTQLEKTHSFSAALVPRCCVFTDTARKACSFYWALGPIWMCVLIHT